MLGKTNQITKYSKSNTLIIILYFFQYGLLLPFSLLLNGQYAIIFFTLLLLLLILLGNRIIITSKIILLILIPFSLLIIKLPFEDYDSTGSNIALEMIISFLTIGISGILIGSLKFSREEFMNYGFKISWINYLLLGFIPFTYLYGEDINYMKFGYSLLPSVLFSFSFLFKKEKRKSALILFLLSFSELLLFGARGAMLTFILFAFLYVYFTSVFKRKFKIYLTLILVLIVSNVQLILRFVVSFLSEYGMVSYSITKYLNLFEGNSFASTTSGRDHIYETAYQRIEDSPWFGNPINTCFIDTGSSYYHNIFLDILVNFGVFIFILFILFILLHFFRAMRSEDEKFKLIFLIVFIVSMGRLVVSSSLWQRPEFWIFMSYCIHFNNKKYKLL